MARIAVRDIQADDLKLIKDSFWRSHHLATRTKGGRRAFRAYYVDGILESLLARPESRALVAVNAEDTSQVLGWILYAYVADVPVIHYIFVKQPFRKVGLARALAQKAGINPTDDIVYTLKNRWSEKLREHHQGRVEHYPIEDYLSEGEAKAV